MPVEFLSDDQASAYGRFPSGFTRTELERYFFLHLDGGWPAPARRLWVHVVDRRASSYT